MSELFRRLNIKYTEESFDKFKVLLEFTITCIGSDLYFPMKLFEQATKTQHQVKAYENKFNEFRTIIFEQRSAITESTFETLPAVSREVHSALERVLNDFKFTLATMPEEFKWVGSCNIHKNVSGVLQSFPNDVVTLLQLLNSITGAD